MTRSLSARPAGARGFARRLMRTLRRRADPEVPHAPRELTPPQFFVAFFGVLTLLGTLGLRFLPGLYADGATRLGWIDALFTATSAVCVTGLIVVDTATYFSRLGQMYLLLLIQLGGLGLLGIASFVIVAFQSRLSLRHDTLIGGGTINGPGQNVRTRSLLRDVLLFTLVVESVTFLALWSLWWGDFGPGEAAWHALFHSVSAFCNAGFSSFSDSLVGFNERPLVLGVVSLCVLVGGIGFLTLEELRLWLRARVRRRRVFRLSLHARFVLVASLVVYILGLVLVFALEWENPRTLKALSFFDSLSNASFMSVSTRTSGFNTVDYGATTHATNFGTIVLMTIGGAPGGTAGGIKVTTVAILAVMAYARLRAKPTVDVWNRTIPAHTTQRAVSLFAFAFSILTAGVLLAAVLELDRPGDRVLIEVRPDGTAVLEDGAPTQPFTPEPRPGEDPLARDAPVPPVREIDPRSFLDVMFEASSAFGTVGLSTGITPSLSDPGRVLMTFLMFIGRVGPLTLAAALSVTTPPTRSFRRFAHEDVAVG